MSDGPSDASFATESGGFNMTKARKPLSPVSGSGADLIAAERRRQIEEEGWDCNNDGGYKKGELLRAAEVYTRVARLGHVYANWQKDWPWNVSWFKPGKRKGGKMEVDAIRCLEKAGALIAADLDRRQATQGP